MKRLWWMLDLGEDGAECRKRFRIFWHQVWLILASVSPSDDFDNEQLRFSNFARTGYIPASGSVGFWLGSDVEWIEVGGKINLFYKTVKAATESYQLIKPKSSTFPDVILLAPTHRNFHSPEYIFYLSITSLVNMAAAIKALNAKIRANPVLDYVCSTRIIGSLSLLWSCSWLDC